MGGKHDGPALFASLEQRLDKVNVGTFDEYGDVTERLKNLVPAMTVAEQDLAAAVKQRPGVVDRRVHICHYGLNGISCALGLALDDLSHLL